MKLKLTLGLALGLFIVTALADNEYTMFDNGGSFRGFSTNTSGASISEVYDWWNGQNYRHQTLTYYETFGHRTPNNLGDFTDCVTYNYKAPLPQVRWTNVFWYIPSPPNQKTTNVETQSWLVDQVWPGSFESIGPGVYRYTNAASTSRGFFYGGHKGQIRVDGTNPVQTCQVTLYIWVCSPNPALEDVAAVHLEPSTDDPGGTWYMDEVEMQKVAPFCFVATFHWVTPGQVIDLTPYQIATPRWVRWNLVNYVSWPEWQPPGE